MKSIFLSYRRDDSRHQAGRLHDRLAAHFGAQQIFKDVDSIPLGLDFREVLTERVAACDVFLAIIGDGWLTAEGKAGSRRLDDPGDFVRIEIEAALSRKIPVIPVLVGHSSIPRAEDLPESLRKLAYRNAIQVRPDPDFHKDADRLIRGIEQGLKAHPKRWTARAPRAPRPPIRTAVAVAFLALAILLGIIYVATDNGQIKIEVDDPNAVVTVDGQKVRIEGLGEPITLRAGPHNLVVKRGDVEVETLKFVVLRGDNPLLKVTLTHPAVDPVPTSGAEVLKPHETPKAVVATPKPPPRTGEALITNTIGMKLKLIPAGEFLMGAADGEPEAFSKEKPQHKVQITQPFYLGIYEVTQAEYRAVVGSNPSGFKSGAAYQAKVAGMNTDRFPVEIVSWLDAVAFCNKLSEREGFKPCDTATGEVIATGTGYRLPTEAEWEYACRAGTTTPFSFGATLTPTDANFEGNYTYNGSAKGPNLKRTAEVGSYQPNAFGLYDMHGNVYEWCRDFFDAGYYAKSPAADPQNLTQAASRVFRGGCWVNSPRECRSASRDEDSPGNRGRGDGLGFRVARVRPDR